MYENHFGLNERPFRNVPDTKMFFNGGGRGDILRELRFAIESGEGIIKVVGEVGSGKTMLCRMLDESLSGKVQVVFLSNPSLEPEYILHAVAQELGLPVTHAINRFTVQQTLQDYLLKQHESGKQVVVLIEEAQCMPPRTLEEIRLMSNLETQKKKLLQLVLFGQPELDMILGRSDLRQFNERISYALYLKPFTLEEHREYLNHRLRVAGYAGPELFNAVVVKHIYKFAKGSVRRINLLADKTLLAAYAYNDTTITIKHARSAAEDSKYIERVHTGVPIKYVIAISTIAVIAILFIFQSAYLDDQVTNSSTETATNKIENTSDKYEFTLKSPETGSNNNADRNSTSHSIASARIKTPLSVAAASPFSGNKTEIKNTAGKPSLAQIQLDRTMKWLKNADKSQYTIQLMTAFVEDPSKLYQLEDILKNKVTPKDTENFLVFRGRVNEQPVLVVCYRLFPRTAPARTAIDNLIPALKRYHPFVRNVSAIVNEIGDKNA